MSNVRPDPITNLTPLPIKPEAFDSPIMPPFLDGFREAELGLVWNAQRHALIGKDKTEINRFLFYTLKDYSLPAVERMVKALPTAYQFNGDVSQLPFPLSEITYRSKADQRKALAGSMNFMD